MKISLITAFSLLLGISTCNNQQIMLKEDIKVTLPTSSQSIMFQDLIGTEWIPIDVDYKNPIYETDFENEEELTEWHLEGGLDMKIMGGSLILTSQGGTTRSQSDANHLVCWLKEEMPADFLLEFTVNPENRNQGLNIVFFNARGIHGESIFDPGLEKRDGTFKQYHSGDLNSYHCSYWAGDRSFSNLRKNKGFYLVATGEDRIIDGLQGESQTVRVYKRGGQIRVMVDDVVVISFDDDGKTYGPIHVNSGWIGLRQMAHTVQCKYGHFKVYPLKK